MPSTHILIAHFTTDERVVRAAVNDKSLRVEIVPVVRLNRHPADDGCKCLISGEPQDVMHAIGFVAAQGDDGLIALQRLEL